jgi:hypothetical protein
LKADKPRRAFLPFGSCKIIRPEAEEVVVAGSRYPQKNRSLPDEVGVALGGALLGQIIRAAGGTKRSRVPLRNSTPDASEMRPYPKVRKPHGFRYTNRRGVKPLPPWAAGKIRAKVDVGSVGLSEEG